MGNKGEFKIGNVPHNFNKKLEDYLSPEKIRLIKKTQFKPGQTAGDKSNMWKGGVQTPKNDCTYLYDGINKRIRRPRTLYEEEYGEIPKGFIIFHVDGDKDNDSLENLEAISRAELVKRNKYKNR